MRRRSDIDGRPGPGRDGPRARQGAAPRPGASLRGRPGLPRLPGRALPRRFYARPVAEVARDLLGRFLVCEAPRGPLVGRIVEVEAYGGADDPASHGFRGETRRNRAMFGPAGHAYVYASYGIHHCLNVVTGRAGRPAAVLIRALEPLAGLAAMARRRGLRDPRRLARGPGCVARALGLTRAHDGLDLTRGPLWVADLAPRREGHRIARGPRVGITRAMARRWRFYLAGHPCVSGGRAAPGRRAVGPARRAWSAPGGRGMDEVTHARRQATRWPGAARTRGRVVFHRPGGPPGHDRLSSQRPFARQARTVRGLRRPRDGKRIPAAAGGNR